MPEISGLPIDATPLPEWAHPYFTPDQLGLDRGLLWVLLIYKARTLGDSATNVAQRYYVHSVGKPKKVAWPSLRSLVGDLELSINTVRGALAKLEADGWLVKASSPSKSQGYALSWPDRDCLTPAAEGPAQCGQPTKTGGWCTRRAGRGATTPGEGPCIEHGGTPKNGKPAAVYQPLIHEGEQGEGGMYQPLIQTDGSGEGAVYQPLTGDVSTADSAAYQPLTSAVSAADTEYVSECVTGVHEESDEGFPPSRAEVEVPPSLEPEEDRSFGEGVGAETAIALEPKHLTPLPDPCNHGIPGGYQPAAEPNPEFELWPSCVVCQSHVMAKQCHKKTRPCPHCNAMRDAAGLPATVHQEAASA